MLRYVANDLGHRWRFTIRQNSINNRWCCENIYNYLKSWLGRECGVKISGERFMAGWNIYPLFASTNMGIHPHLATQYQARAWSYIWAITHRLSIDKCVPLRALWDLKQSGRSPKVVALFLLQTLVAIQYDCFYCMTQSKRNHSLVPNLVAFIAQNEKNVWFFD